MALHAGIYTAGLPALWTDDEDLRLAADQFIGIFANALRMYRLEGDEMVHALRALDA